MRLLIKYCNMVAWSSSTSGLSRELEELMVEGLLLPVSLPETQDLYHVLLHRPLSQPPAGCLSPPQDDSSDCTKHIQFGSQGKNLSWADVRQPVPRDQI